jgi:hypothetical protein
MAFYLLLGNLPIVSLFHWRALLFFVKVVKRAFEFGDPLGNEVQIKCKSQRNLSEADFGFWNFL